MALDLSPNLTSGDSSLTQAKQVWGCSAPQGKSFVIGSFRTYEHASGLKETYETMEVGFTFDQVFMV